MIEIERKFLVTSDSYKTMAFANHEIAQGYLNSTPERTVRVRIKGNKGYLTIKGKGNESGISRFEWEKEIELSEEPIWLGAEVTNDDRYYNAFLSKNPFKNWRKG